MGKKESITTGFIWRFLERCGAQGVTFIVSIVLARVLDPEVYGTVALVTVFTSIMQTFVDGGLSTALIQKKDADDVDFSTVFYVNLIMCILLYGILYFLAEPIAHFYDRPELVSMVRIIGLTLIISGVKSIQQAYVSRHMIYKKFFFATLGGTIIAAVAGLTMVYMGYGVWALIAQNLINKTIDTVILWFTVKWRPKKYFDVNRLTQLCSFGWKILATTLVDRLYRQLRSLIIGKVYSANDLAYYNRGEQYPGLVIDNIEVSIDSVLLPSMSSVQDDKKAVKNLTKLSMQVSSYVLMPILMGLAVCSPIIVKLMITDKWLPCVPYLQIFCFIYALRPINTSNLNAFKAMGRSDIVLKTDLIKKVFGLVTIIITVKISALAMAIGLAVQTIFAVMLNARINAKLLDYSIKEQMEDMLSPAIITCIMGGIVYSVNFLRINEIITLIVQVIVGVVAYLLLSQLLKVKGYNYVIVKIKSILGKRTMKGGNK